MISSHRVFGSGLLQRAVRIVAVAMVLLGLFFLLWIPLVVRPSETYLAQPACRTALLSRSQHCYAMVPMSIVRAGLVVQGNGDHLATIELKWGDFAIANAVVVRPPHSFFRFQPGQRVTVKVYDNVPEAVYPRTGDAMRLLSDPLNLQALFEALGGELAGVGLFLLVSLFPDTLISTWSGKRLFGKDGVAGGRPFFLQRLRQDRSFQLVLLAILISQGLDVSTTLASNPPQAYEANQMVNLMDFYFGPWLGLLTVKFPLVTALLLAISRLSHRFMLLSGWLACWVTAVVALDNAVILATNHSFL